MLTQLVNINVELPLRDIFARLGYRKSSTELTEEKNKEINKITNEAFIHCNLKGVYGKLQIESNSNNIVKLENGIIWESKDISKFLSHSQEVILFAVTAGKDIVDIRDNFIQEGENFKAIIYDAVGSEVADAGADWINSYLKKLLEREYKQITKRRFSPGYGDLNIKNQKEVFKFLELNKLEIELTDSFLMIPEKTVTALVGSSSLI